MTEERASHLQRRAEAAAKNFDAARKPIVFEFAGVPKAGKTSTLNALYSLPALPLSSWDDVKLRTEKLPREKRYKQFNPEAFREIRAAVERFLAESA